MKPMVWMFSGQGSQYFQMGRDLWDSEPLFRRTLETCSEILEPALGVKLTEELYRERPDRFAPFDRTRHSNPAIVALQVGVARLLRARGQGPDLVLGYSLGGITAGIVAGALSLEDGLSIALRLAELAESLVPPGAMLAVLGPASLVEERPDWFEGTRVAARNFPGHFVVAGPPEPIRRLEALLAKAQHGVQKLPVEFAFHSPVIEPMGAAFQDFVRSLTCVPAALEMISASDGRRFRTIDAAALWRTIRQPVVFETALQAIEAEGPFHYLDLGPAGTLANFVRYGLPAGSRSEVATTVTPYGTTLPNLELLAATS